MPRNNTTRHKRRATSSVSNNLHQSKRARVEKDHATPQPKQEPRSWKKTVRKLMDFDHDDLVAIVSLASLGKPCVIDAIESAMRAVVDTARSDERAPRNEEVEQGEEDDYEDGDEYETRSPSTGFSSAASYEEPELEYEETSEFLTKSSPVPQVPNLGSDEEESSDAGGDEDDKTHNKARGFSDDGEDYNGTHPDRQRSNMPREPSNDGEYSHEAIQSGRQRLYLQDGTSNDGEMYDLLRAQSRRRLMMARDPGVVVNNRGSGLHRLIYPPY